MKGIDGTGQPKRRLAEAVDGNGTGRRHVELKGRLPGEEESVAGGGDAGEHGIRIQVHGFDSIGNRAAPAYALAATEIGGDGLPCGGLVEVREELSGSWTELALICVFGGWRNQRAGVGDDRRAACVKKVLHTKERRIEREGAATLRSLEGNGQQFAHGDTQAPARPTVPE